MIIEAGTLLIEQINYGYAIEISLGHAGNEKRGVHLRSGMMRGCSLYVWSFHNQCAVELELESLYCEPEFVKLVPDDFT